MRSRQIGMSLILAGALVFPAIVAMADRVDQTTTVYDDEDSDNSANVSASGPNFFVEHTVRDLSVTCEVYIASELPNKVSADAKGKSAKISQTAGSLVEILTPGSGGNCAVSPCQGNPSNAKVSASAKGNGLGAMTSAQVKSSFKAEAGDFTPTPLAADILACEDAFSDRDKKASFKEKNGSISYKASLKDSSLP